MSDNVGQGVWTLGSLPHIGSPIRQLELGRLKCLVIDNINYLWNIFSTNYYYFKNDTITKLWCQNEVTGQKKVGNPWCGLGRFLWSTYPGTTIVITIYIRKLLNTHRAEILNSNSKANNGGSFNLTEREMNTDTETRRCWVCTVCGSSFCLCFCLFVFVYLLWISLYANVRQHRHTVVLTPLPLLQVILLLICISSPELG